MVLETQTRQTKSRSPPGGKLAKIPRTDEGASQQCLAVAPMDESLSMPAAGLAPGSSNPLALPTPKANPLPGSEVDIHELVSASSAAQTDDFAGAVQQKMSANIVEYKWVCS